MKIRTLICGNAGEIIENGPVQYMLDDSVCENAEPFFCYMDEMPSKIKTGKYEALVVNAGSYRPELMDLGIPVYVYAYCEPEAETKAVSLGTIENDTDLMERVSDAVSGILAEKQNNQSASGRQSRIERRMNRQNSQSIGEAGNTQEHRENKEEKGNMQSNNAGSRQRNPDTLNKQEYRGGRAAMENSNDRSGNGSVSSGGSARNKTRRAMVPTYGNSNSYSEMDKRYYQHDQRSEKAEDSIPVTDQSDYGEVEVITRQDSRNRGYRGGGPSWNADSDPYYPYDLNSRRYYEETYQDSTKNSGYGDEDGDYQRKRRYQPEPARENGGNPDRYYNDHAMDTASEVQKEYDKSSRQMGRMSGQRNIRAEDAYSSYEDRGYSYDPARYPGDREAHPYPAADRLVRNAYAENSSYLQDHDADVYQKDRYEPGQINRPGHERRSRYDYDNNMENYPDRLQSFNPPAASRQIGIPADRFDRASAVVNGFEKTKAQCFTIYSNKGGVGKTVFAFELAARLASTEKNGQRYSVCLVDYDLGGGGSTRYFLHDVEGNAPHSILDFKNEYISDFIRYRGQEPVYMKDEIRRNLLNFNNESFPNFYCLAAPPSELCNSIGVTAEEADRTGLTEDEIETKVLKSTLKNIIENGGFDFVIVDTGNNLDDSSYIAVSTADNVFVVADQNKATLSNNASALNMFIKNGGMKQEKFSMVINRKSPGNKVGIDEDMIKHYLPIPVTGVLCDSEDVRLCMNQGFALSCLKNKANHQFSKEIGRIVNGIVTKNSPESPEGLHKKTGKKFWQFWKK